MANLASNTLYKETLSKFLQVPVKNLYTSRTFGILPADVLADPGLSPAAKLVFCAIAMHSFKTGHVTDASHGVLAELCGLTRPTVMRALSELTGSGLIERAGKCGQVMKFRILHARFKGKGQDPVEGSQKLIPATRAAVRCLKCPNRMLRPHRSGICRDCRDEMKMERTARRVVSEELGRIPKPKAAAG